jgi:hypothetical protein
MSRNRNCSWRRAKAAGDSHENSRSGFSDRLSIFTFTTARTLHYLPKYKRRLSIERAKAACELFLKMDINKINLK